MTLPRIRPSPRRSKPRLRLDSKHWRNTRGALTRSRQRRCKPLDVKLDYLINASRRLGRKDWLNVCAGTILVYILTASVPPEGARDMFLGILRAIGHLLVSQARPCCRCDSGPLCLLLHHLVGARPLSSQGQALRRLARPRESEPTDNAVRPVCEDDDGISSQPTLNMWPTCP